MSLWLLLLDRSSKGLAVPVGFDQRDLTTSPAGKRPVFKAAINPDEGKALWLSAQKGVTLSGALMWREGYLDKSITMRFTRGALKPADREANEDTGDQASITGTSADLLFALAFVTRAVPRDYPALAATGVLEEDNRQVFVRWVKGVPAKIDAALKVLPPKGLIFYPKANHPDIGRDLHDKADAQEVRLVPVERLEEALEYLGLKIEGVYTRPPYLGLQSFGYAERGIFCGRDAEIAALQSLLLQREQAGKPGALILAASGAGKSSLAQAGLLPALEKAGWPLSQTDTDNPPDPLHLALAARPVLWAETWKLPQLDSERNAAGLLRSIAKNWTAVPELKGLPPVESLAQLADAYAIIAPKQRRFLWLIDQLEELFTLGFPAEAVDAFADFLQRLQARGVWLVAMLRNDFYPHYQQHEPKIPGQARLLDVFGGAAHYDLIKPADAMFRRIIEQPADKAGLVFETAADGRSLADQIVQDLRDGGVDALPLLQFALKEVWERREGGKYLTFRAYSDIGGLHGAIGNRADSVYRQLEPAAQAVLPKLLWDLAIVREKHGEAGQHQDRDYVAQAVNLADYPEGSDGRKLIKSFADWEVRLLVHDGGKVRVAHEALFRHWQTAQSELELLHADMALRDQVRHEHKAWLAHGKPADLLLLPVKRLADGEHLLKEREAFLEPELVAYIRASSEAEAERQRQEAERQQQEQDLKEDARQQAELARERAEQVARQQTELAEQQTQLAQERQEKAEKLRRKARQLLAAAVVSLAAAGVAGWYWWDAGKQRETAEAKTREVEKKKAELAETLARSDFVKAAELAQQNNSRGALAYLARAIRTNWEKRHGILANSILIYNKIAIINVFPHLNSVSSATFSPDGRRVVTASEDNTARVWDSQTGQPVTAPLQHQRDVLSATFSPEGQQLVTISGNVALIWNANTGQMVTEKLQHQRDVLSAAFSPDGRRVVTASEDNTARIWDAQTGQPVIEPLQHQMDVRSAVFSPDGRWVVTASRDRTARVWDAQTGQPVTPPLKHDAELYTAIFSPDGRRVVTASEDNTARIWDTQTGQQIGLPLHHQSKVYSVTFNPDGRGVVTRCGDGAAHIWDIQTSQLLTSPLHLGWVNSAAFSPDGRRVVTASRDRTAQLWDVQAIRPTSMQLQHQGWVNSAIFSPNGQMIISASDDHVARIWDTQTGKAVISIMQNQNDVRSAVFSPDGQQVVTSGLDTAHVWDAKTGQMITTLTQRYDWLNPALFSPDKRRVIATFSKSAIVMDRQTNAPLTLPMLHKNTIFSAVFSPDGRRVATASWDQTARVWDALTGQPVTPSLQHHGQVSSIVFSPNGKKVVTASSDKTARVWDAQTGLPITPPLEHDAWLYTAVFSPDGRRVVTTSWDRTARVWDAQTGLPVTESLQHHGDVLSAAFSPDGQLVATASDDHTARVWDTQTGLPVTPPLQHQGTVWSAAFSPDGRWVVTASHDKTTRIWEIGNMPFPGMDFATFLESISGYRLSDSGGLEHIPTKSKPELRAWLSTAQDLSPEARHLIKWLLSNPLERTVTPNGKQTVKERVQQLIDIDTIASLNEALDYWPGHPMALAKLAAATLRDGKPEERESNMPRARLWANLALKYAPEDTAVHAIAEAVLRETGGS